MTPEQRYQRGLAAGDVLPDAAQQQAVRHTQRTYEDLSRDGQGRGPLLRELGGPVRRSACSGAVSLGGVGRQDLPGGYPVRMSALRGQTPHAFP